MRMHSGNGEHPEMDERAQICFAQALDDAGLPDDARLRATLRAYFRWAVGGVSGYPKVRQTTFPTDPVLAQWSWNGPV